jgi:hypothetical protein
MRKGRFAKKRDARVGLEGHMQKSFAVAETGVGNSFN